MNDTSIKEELTLKIQRWLKENVSIIALVILCVVYILYGIVTIDKTGKTVGQIVADGGVSFLVGFTIKCLMNNQGLTNGEQSQGYVNSRLHYLSLLDETSNIQHYLEIFCDMENEKSLVRVQKSILRTQNIKYEDFVNNNLDYSKLDKKQKKAVYKAREVKIHLINDAILLSDSQITLDLGKDLNVSKKSYLKSSNTTTLIIMLLIAFLFGYYGIDPQKGFNWHNAIWCAIQVAIYLALGTMQYFQGYSFMADTYKTALVRKANFLEKFKNMYNEDKTIFTVKKEENKEDGNNSRLEKEIPTNGTEQSSRDEQLSKCTEESIVRSSTKCPCTEIFQS